MSRSAVVSGINSTWLHDVIYDSKASDNEERSAEYAERLCKELTVPDAQLVAALILKMKTHAADAKVLLDADLAILGASEAVYRIYTDQIRQEFGWVPKFMYRRGRRSVLEGFLKRPRIYDFLSQLEEPARRNIAREAAGLA